MPPAPVRKKEFIEPIPLTNGALENGDEVICDVEDGIDEIDDTELPGLEFLDVADGFELVTEEIFSARSPFIPPPFIDADLKPANLSMIDEFLEEEELLCRAPYIPPPCIDIISFDDMTENFLDMNDSISAGVDVSTTGIDSTTMLNEFYDIGNAKVPGHLLPKHMSMPDKVMVPELKC